MICPADGTEVAEIITRGILAVAGLCWPAIPFAESRSISGGRLDIGVSDTLHSRAIGEQRIVNLVLPASYQFNLGRRYPVLYFIDGGMEQDLLHIAGLVRLGAI